MRTTRSSSHRMGEPVGTKDGPVPNSAGSYNGDSVMSKEATGKAGKARRATPPSPTPTPKRIKLPLKRPRKTKWDISTVLTSEKSPLAKCDLRSILQHPLAWDCLSPEEQAEILSQFPDTTHILDAGTPKARPNVESLLNDNHFRHDCSRYIEDLSLGKHDPQWLTEAWEAHGRRGAGDFDDFLEQKLEADWGLKLGGEDSEAEVGEEAPDREEGKSKPSLETVAGAGNGGESGGENSAQGDAKVKRDGGMEERQNCGERSITVRC